MQFNFNKSLDLGLKNPGLPYWAWISFIDILELDLKNTWTNLLDSDLLYYNQEGMLLEKSEYLLELSVSNTIKISKFNSLGQSVFVV